MTFPTDKWEKVRDSKCAVGERMTYDCFHLRVKGLRAYCSKGKHLGQARDGSLDLLYIMRGMSSGVCKCCADFVSE